MGRQHSPTDDLRDLRAILASETLTTSERIVLVAILAHRNGDSGRCDPSLARLAGQTGMTERGVRLVIRRMEAAGYLLSNRREGRSTCYSIAVPTPERGSPRNDVPPGSEFRGPRNDVPPTPERGSPERTKERTKGTNEQRPSARADGDAPFGELWKLHPRGSKKDARTQYRKATKDPDVTHDRIADGLRQYLDREVRGRSGDDFKGAHLFRWIRDRRWEEQEDAPDSGSGGGGPGDEKPWWVGQTVNGVPVKQGAGR
jgi:hypothetical protein